MDIFRIQTYISYLRTLKKYVKVVMILLWLYVGLVLAEGVYIFVTGHHPLVDIINKGKSLLG